MSSSPEPGYTPTTAVPSVFPGDGEMAQLCREADWAATPLGPVDGWPQSLKTVAATVLGSGFPMILVWGPELVQVYNDAYVPLIGRKHPAALGMPTHECWPEIRHLQEPVFRRVFGGETVNLAEARYPLVRNGFTEDLYFDATFVPVPLETGGIGGSVSTLFDVTSRVTARALEAEREKFQLLVEHSNDGHALFDSEGRLLWANRLMSERLGYTLKELRTLTIPDINPDFTLAWYRSVFERARRERVRPFETVHRRKDGTTFPVEITPTVVEMAEGTRMFSSVRDITERRQAEAERERLLAQAEAARMEAEAANRAKSEFLAIMSHELRTPLNAISGYTDLMEMGIHGPVTEAQRKALGRIQLSQQHLLGLINDVLNYARIETGSVRYDVGDVHVGDLLATVEGLIEPQMRSKGLTLVVDDCPPDLAVRADPEKLRQILLNLLSNAAKFTDPGGHVALTCEPDGERVLLTVRDTGIGIPADKLEAIFDPFVQVRSDLTRSAEGTGLGLAISRDLARGMDGELTAESTPGEGSRFVLHLPRSVPGES
ncbi:MAG TPA: PAS domain-containing sensor histidine kinase [Longimicrobiaceae bacterium]|nr:PAS domain-containing sensor histidine kinase [Longimicrobiaceae bacterium]